MQQGQLASDLARIASLLGMKVEDETTRGVMEEARLFSEWTGANPGISPETQEWDSKNQDTVWRKELSDCLRAWSDDLLKEAGFLDGNE